jgi:hypothetical protein
LIGVSNKQVLEVLNRSHIVLNQFYCFLPGTFGIEAMATGNAVLMSAEYEGMPNGANDAWFKTGYWQVYDNLKYLLDNPHKIEEYAKAGHNYVQKNFSIAANQKYFNELFQNQGIISD